MNLDYRVLFSELIKSLGENHTSAYRFDTLVFTLEETCSLNDLERILEVYKAQIED